MEGRTEWKDGEKKDSRKTETKITKECCENGKTEWTFRADKFAAMGKMKDLIKDDWQADAHIEGEFKPAKDEWKIEAAVCGHTPDFNGIQGWFHVRKISLTP